MPVPSISKPPRLVIFPSSSHFFWVGDVKQPIPKYLLSHIVWIPFSKKSTPTNPPNMSGKNPTPTSLDQTNEAKQKHPVKKEILPLCPSTDPLIFPKFPNSTPHNPIRHELFFGSVRFSGPVGSWRSGGIIRKLESIVRAVKRRWVIAIDGAGVLMGSFHLPFPGGFQRFFNSTNKKGRSRSCQQKMVYKSLNISRWIPDQGQSVELCIRSIEKIELSLSQLGALDFRMKDLLNHLSQHHVNPLGARGSRETFPHNWQLWGPKFRETGSQRIP